MSNNKIILITIVVIFWMFFVVTSQYPDRIFKDIDTPVEGNYLAY